MSTTDLIVSAEMKALQKYLSERVAPTLLELRRILPEQVYVVERGFVEGDFIASEIVAIATTHDEAIEWVATKGGDFKMFRHEIKSFPVRQSVAMRKEERYWTRIMRPWYDRRPGPVGTEDIQCGTYFSIVWISLGDLALHLNNR